MTESRKSNYMEKMNAGIALSFMTLVLTGLYTRECDNHLYDAEGVQHHETSRLEKASYTITEQQDR